MGNRYLGGRLLVGDAKPRHVALDGRIELYQAGLDELRRSVEFLKAKRAQYFVA